MIITLPSGTRVHLIGDPHLGKRFESGVPLNRRGERELSQLAHFKAELAAPCDINIMVGDLTDHPHVGYSVVLDAANAYLDAACAAPDTQFIAIAGNHDRSRNVGTVGAWEVFSELVRQRYNITVLDEPAQVGPVALFPWEWVGTAEAQLPYLQTTGPVELCVGHWDFIDYGGNTDHMAPAKSLRRLFPDAILASGHYHLAGTYTIAGVEVICTGSMEPYSHGEDPEGEIYCTVNIAEIANNPEAFKDKCVRVLLHEGEELPIGLDCLALTAKRVMAEDTGPSVAETMTNFDWGEILERCLADVTPEVRSFIDERLRVE